MWEAAVRQVFDSNIFFFPKQNVTVNCRHLDWSRRNLLPQYSCGTSYAKMQLRSCVIILISRWQQLQTKLSASCDQKTFNTLRPHFKMCILHEDFQCWDNRGQNSDAKFMSEEGMFCGKQDKSLHYCESESECEHFRRHNVSGGLTLTALKWHIGVIWGICYGPVPQCG